MLKGQLFCDYIVLPYLEAGEAASAGMGNIIETAKYIFATRNCCFEEFKKFSGEAFFSFDMGNYMELAEKILRLPDYAKVECQRQKYLKQYSITEIVKFYLSVFNNK